MRLVTVLVGRSTYLAVNRAVAFEEAGSRAQGLRVRYSGVGGGLYLFEEDEPDVLYESTASATGYEATFKGWLDPSRCAVRSRRSNCLDLNRRCARCRSRRSSLSEAAVSIVTSRRPQASEARSRSPNNARRSTGSLLKTSRT